MRIVLSMTSVVIELLGFATASGFESGSKTDCDGSSTNVTVESLGIYRGIMRRGEGFLVGFGAVTCARDSILSSWGGGKAAKQD